MQITRPQLEARLMLMGVPSETAKTFIDFHAKNRQIWMAFKTATQRLIKAGHEHWGAKAIFEYLRYQSAVNGRDGFKLNNNYPAYYARLWQIACPEHASFFETREITGLQSAEEKDANF